MCFEASNETRSDGGSSSLIWIRGLLPEAVLRLATGRRAGPVGTGSGVRVCAVAISLSIWNLSQDVDMEQSYHHQVREQ
ncbi:hypothetical protein DTO271D3_8307 [Paecilomyces variotii]|nr:hypothetical protein DTO271D3_8307 [Paecilomyces variotii]